MSVTTNHLGQEAGVPYKNTIVLYFMNPTRPCSSVYATLEPGKVGTAGALFMYSGLPANPRDGRFALVSRPRGTPGAEFLNYPAAVVARDAEGLNGAGGMVHEIMAGHKVELFWPGTGPIKPAERQALKDFYSSAFVGEVRSEGAYGTGGTVSKAEFLADDNLDPCGGAGNASTRLEGINCIGGRVVQMRYTPVSNFETSVSSPWPSSLGAFEHLQYFHFWPSPVTGAGGVVVFPDTIKNWKRLRTFSWCNPGSLALAIRLPGSIGTLSNLKHLELQGVAHDGVFPSSALALPAVETILISGISVGVLPPVSSMAKLRVLQLAASDVSGELPSFKGLSKLTAVFLQGNALKGGHTGAFDGCTSLQTLNLASNKLTGPLFSFVNCSRLQDVDLSNNEFTGAIPSLWVDLDTMAQLNVKHNLLGGRGHLSVLTPLSGMSGLLSFDLSHNRFEYPWESNEVANPPVNGNIWFGGFMPPDVRFVDLSHNRIKTPSLSERPSFYTNMVSGVAPPTLVSLKISHNQLRGYMLLEGVFYNMDYSHNNITAVEPLDLNTVQTGDVSQHVDLRSVDLSHQSGQAGAPVGFYDAANKRTAHSVDEYLASTSAGFMMFIPSPREFNKVEFPSGSNRFPFSCPAFFARGSPDMVVKWDPAVYGYSGGSKPSLRLKWLHPTLDGPSYRAQFIAAFGGENGFCRCEPGHFGSPPNCYRFASRYSRRGAIGHVADARFGDGRTKDGMDTAWHVMPDRSAGYQSHTLVFSRSALAETDLLVVYAGANKTNERLFSFSADEPPRVGQEYHVVGPDFLLHYFGQS
eukprot:g395.t1